MTSDIQAFKAAPFIKEIGRGKKGARSLSRADARQLYAAMLDQRVTELELGGILLAMRIKGESVDEIAGFLDAAEQSFALLPAPPGELAPVVIPSYNGSRQMPNLTPLLAMLLAREGVPVLMHGVTSDPGRVTSAEILGAMGIAPAMSADAVQQSFTRRQPAFLPIETLAPKMARLLAVRRVLGVRNSTHTLVKILQPFECPALRLTSYTHPEYLLMLGEYFSTLAPAGRGDVFLMRGTEGETVANPKRANQIDWFHAGERQVLVERQAPVEQWPDLPVGSDSAATAHWIQSALRGEVLIPDAILEQTRHCLSVARALRA
ncbi:DNA-binding protein YbiB [Lacisediminimonas profundi]|uniref:DNA-binding protein YbiB n=1 Tax=Lacisediminimonas profundi TaxID=2603856 RepID=UPI00124B3209|nr:DNA-binding protein YbiB [Lacisediminimonas profundi]